MRAVTFGLCKTPCSDSAFQHVALTLAITCQKFSDWKFLFLPEMMKRQLLLLTLDWFRCVLFLARVRQKESFCLGLLFLILALVFNLQFVRLSNGQSVCSLMEGGVSFYSEVHVSSMHETFWCSFLRPCASWKTMETWELAEFLGCSCPITD